MARETLITPEGLEKLKEELEYLESEFYRQVVASKRLGGKTAATIQRFGAQEAQHVAALEALVRKLGGKLPAKPTPSFQLTTPNFILQTASSLEYTGAAAYLGQAGRIQSKEVLAAALSIHTVEARHDAALNLMLGKDVSPDGAFAKPQFVADVLQTVRPFMSQ